MAFRTIAAIAAGTIMLTACVNHTWAPPPAGSPLSYDQQAAQCRLFARGIMPSGGFIAASGSPQFVGATMGGYALGAAIGGAIRINQNFNDCMLASGWQAVDGKKP
jgi:hypothetical protein